ncbi:MAG: hypothetical protein EOP37_03165 [Rubrivivax sp.]|nr:MAG: hypothetical protein EOP37_03165 [Rubrivivax sp.]
MWHFEITEGVLRDVPSREAFADYAAFEAVATVVFLNRGRVFIRAALRTDGRGLRTADFRDIARKLRDEYGVDLIEYDRKGVVRSWPTARAW